MKAITEYLVGVKDEMGKVTWPSKDEVVQATTLVVVFALVLSLVIAGFDTLVALVVGKIL